MLLKLLKDLFKRSTWFFVSARMVRKALAWIAAAFIVQIWHRHESR